MAKIKDKTLCKLVANKAVKKKLGSYKELIDAPQFVCLRCGRAANRRKSLCDPARL
jgi:hypothetical protein